MALSPNQAPQPTDLPDVSAAMESFADFTGTFADFAGIDRNFSFKQLGAAIKMYKSVNRDPEATKAVDDFSEWIGDPTKLDPAFDAEAPMGADAFSDTIRYYTQTEAKPSTSWTLSKDELSTAELAKKRWDLITEQPEARSYSDITKEIAESTKPWTEVHTEQDEIDNPDVYGFNANDIVDRLFEELATKLANSMEKTVPGGKTKGISEMGLVNRLLNMNKTMGLTDTALMDIAVRASEIREELEMAAEIAAAEEPDDEPVPTKPEVVPTVTTVVSNYKNELSNYRLRTVPGGKRANKGLRDVYDFFGSPEKPNASFDKFVATVEKSVRAQMGPSAKDEDVKKAVDGYVADMWTQVKANPTAGDKKKWEADKHDAESKLSPADLVAKRREEIRAEQEHLLKTGKLPMSIKTIDQAIDSRFRSYIKANINDPKYNEALDFKAQLHLVVKQELDKAKVTAADKNSTDVAKKTAYDNAMKAAQARLDTIAKGIAPTPPSKAKRAVNGAKSVVKRVRSIRHK